MEYIEGGIPYYRKVVAAKACLVVILCILYNGRSKNNVVQLTKYRITGGENKYGKNRK